MINSSTQKGQTLVISVIAIVILVSLLNLVGMAAIAPTQNTAKDGVRLVLTVSMCMFLYQGYGWARWVLGVLLGLGGLVAIPGALLVLTTSFFGALWILAIGVLYLGCAWVLLRSPEIKAFLAAQRAKRVN